MERRAWGLLAPGTEQEGMGIEGGLHQLEHLVTAGSMR